MMQQKPADDSFLGRPPIDRRWSVNGRFLARVATGVDRYAQEILRAMDALVCEGHPLTAGLTLDILCPAGTVDASPFVDIPLRLLPSAPGHFWEQFILPGHVCGGLLSLCNTGPIALKKQIVCIHDLNSRIMPESYGLMFRAVYRVLVPALGRRAAQIVTVSRFSQKIIGRFDIKPVWDETSESALPIAKKPALSQRVLQHNQTCRNTPNSINEAIPRSLRNRPECLRFFDVPKRSKRNTDSDQPLGQLADVPTLCDQPSPCAHWCGRELL